MTEGTDEAGVASTDGAEATDDVVVCSEVTKTYDGARTVEALSDVSLSLSSGSYAAVMGPSGSGKSTLLNLVGGLDTLTGGTATSGARGPKNSWPTWAWSYCRTQASRRSILRLAVYETSRW